MLLDRRVIVVLDCWAGRDGGGGLSLKGLFGIWCLVKDGCFGFSEIIVRREEISDVRLVIVGANTTEEGDTILWTQFLNQTLSVQLSSHARTGKQTLGKPQFFNHSCSHNISASGRFAGSFWKHCLRKSSRRGETASGMGGSVSSTIRNMTMVTW